MDLTYKQPNTRNPLNTQFRWSNKDFILHNKCKEECKLLLLLLLQ